MRKVLKIKINANLYSGSKGQKFCRLTSRFRPIKTNLSNQKNRALLRKDVVFFSSSNLVVVVECPSEKTTSTPTLHAMPFTAYLFLTFKFRVSYGSYSLFCPCCRCVVGRGHTFLQLKWYIHTYARIMKIVYLSSNVTTGTNSRALWS